MTNIRPLRSSDKDDILEIAKHTWDGHDYLPYFFDSWLIDENAHTAAIEEDGHVIALANLRVIDAGKTGWMEALRVHPNFRDRHLASILTQHIVKMAREIPVQRIRYTTAVGNDRSLHLGASVGMTRKFDLAIHWQDHPETITWRSSNSAILKVRASDLYPPLHESKLVPNDIIIYDWKALDVTLENLDKIGSFSNFWLQRDSDSLTSFSLGFTRDEKSGQQWCCTIYAKEKDGFLDQLSHHVQLATENNCLTIFVTYNPEHVDAFYSLDWIKIDEDDDEEMYLTLLERELS